MQRILTIFVFEPMCILRYFLTKLAAVLVHVLSFKSGFLLLLLVVLF